jgi:NAD(P)-dependent dehydrogenase (short-subunit alcohol dehydrogenase family)
MHKVLAIVGMGPQLGMAVARRFGLEGYRLGLVARNRERLAGYVATLQHEGIDAAHFAADACDRAQLELALDGVSARFGPVDVLEYSPMIDGRELRSAAKTTPANVMPFMDLVVYGAIIAASRVLDGMIERADGALLFTSGLSAVVPLPSHTNVAIAMAGLHRYVESLHVSLSDTGVYAGNLVIGELRRPEEYADILWNMAEKRERPDVVIGDPVPLAAFETLVVRGFAQAHPARLLKPLPAPRSDHERDTLLLALVHAHMNAVRFEDAPDILANIEQEVTRLGGNMQKPHFGARQTKQQAAVGLGLEH